MNTIKVIYKFLKDKEGKECADSWMKQGHTSFIETNTLKYLTMYDVINQSFIWDSTVEGDEYWRTIAHRHKSKLVRNIKPITQSYIV